MNDASDTLSAAHPAGDGLEVVAWRHRGREKGSSTWSLWRDGRNQSFDTADGWEFEEQPLVTLTQANAALSALQLRVEELTALVTSSEKQRYRVCAEMMERADAAEAEVKRLREALEPFANWPDEFGRRDEEVYLGSTRGNVTFGDFRRVRAALIKEGGNGE